jgi:hypothetical protein
MAELRPPVVPPTPEEATAPASHAPPEGSASETAQAELEWLIGAARKVSSSSPSRVIELTARCLELAPGQPDCLRLSESAKTRLAELEAAEKTPAAEGQAERKAPEDELTRMQAKLGLDTKESKPRMVNMMLDNARRLVRLKYYSEASFLAEECLSLEPNHVECLFLAGMTLVRTGRVELGAKRYRRFLKVAPQDHPEYSSVKLLVADYDQSRRGAPSGSRRGAPEVKPGSPLPGGSASSP